MASSLVLLAKNMFSMVLENYFVVSEKSIGILIITSYDAISGDSV